MRQETPQPPADALRSLPTLTEVVELSPATPSAAPDRPDAAARLEQRLRDIVAPLLDRLGDTLVRELAAALDAETRRALGDEANKPSA